VGGGGGWGGGGNRGAGAGPRVGGLGHDCGGWDTTAGAGTRLRIREHTYLALHEHIHYSWSRISAEDLLQREFLSGQRKFQSLRIYFLVINFQEMTLL
jgi:hypothetical protein